MSDLISVIIPVYNVEKYIKKCLNSVINQTYKNLEIILVDDGSTDNSREICDNYARQDNRIKVIHKKNGGLSSARNEALKIATGFYIGFVDSDDYIEPDMYQVLYNLIKKNNADISMVSFYEETHDKVLKEKNSKKLYLYENLDILKELLINKNLQNTVWNKLYSKKLFETIRFPTGKNYEDIGTTYFLFEKSKKLVYLEIPKYHHLTRIDSICGIRNVQTRIDLLNVIYDRYLYLKDKKPTLNIYNAYSFVLYMLISYEDIAYSNVDKDTFDKYDFYFNRNYKHLVDIINNYEKDIISYFTNYQKALLYLILYDKDNSKLLIKELYNKQQNI